MTRQLIADFSTTPLSFSSVNIHAPPRNLSTRGRLYPESLRGAVIFMPVAHVRNRMCGSCLRPRRSLEQPFLDSGKVIALSRKRSGQPDDFCVSAVHGPTKTSDVPQVNNHHASDLLIGDLSAGPTAEEFKSALGQFLTGLTVVATRDRAGPIGMTCQAFTAVSLVPPLVLFCARTQSETACAIAETGTFSVSMLGKHQRAIAERFGSPASHIDRFNGIDWTPGATTGCPLLNGAIAHLECVLRTSHPAGDHRIYIGQVVAAGAYTDSPLTYFQGRYK